MTGGIGGSSYEKELEYLQPQNEYKPIDNHEREIRIEKARDLMKHNNIDALYLDVSTSLFYFTGLKLWASERLHGAIIPVDGEIIYICPSFEEEKIRTMLKIDGHIRTWEEHENPSELVKTSIEEKYGRHATLAIDIATPFFIFDGIMNSAHSFQFKNSSQIIAPCRMHKSDAEISLIQHAMNITLKVQESTAKILYEGISTIEVQQFLTDAHLKLGTDGPPIFRIVLFGEPTAYPHGVPYPQTLREGDMVLIDTVATIDGYHSDITRTYVFGKPTQKQRLIWDLEKKAQAAVFDAARIGATAESLDQAARSVIEEAGFGPGYNVPGLPHRTGHGIGLDVHEWIYIVKGNKTHLAPGMCFSNEPMICIYGEFGVRLEDHVYMTEEGPMWFTQPSLSIDQPFGKD